MKVELEWDAGAWLASIPDVPGCHTYGTNMPQALRRVRQAIQLFCSDAATLPLEPHPILPDALQASVDDARAARANAEVVAGDARKTLKGAAITLTAGGLSRRDAATMLGISHQRVQQLLDGR